MKQINVEDATIEELLEFIIEQQAQIIGLQAALQQADQNIRTARAKVEERRVAQKIIQPAKAGI